MKQNIIPTVSGHAFVSLKAIAVSVAVACTATTAAANDEKLYGAPLPDNAAFVRVLGAQPDATPEAFGVPLTSDGNYTVVLADKTDGIEADQYITILPDATVLHEPHVDAAKVQIGVFNGGYDSSITLKTADGKVAIIEALPNAAGFREVNPVVVPVAIFTGDVMLGDSIELQLRRGENPSIFVAPDGSVSTILSTIIWDE